MTTTTLPKKNIYRHDFAETDWGIGKGYGDTIVCAPVLPSEFNSTLLDKDGKPVEGAVFLGQIDDAPAALIYRVVELAPGAAEKVPGLEAGHFVLARNMSGHTTSARVKFFLFAPDDIL